MHSISRTPPTPSSVVSVLGVLAEAYSYAVSLARDPAEFAVDVRELQAAGYTKNDIRWLLANGYAEKRHKTPGAQGQGRNDHDLEILPDSRVNLTAAGAEFAKKFEMLMNGHALDTRQAIPVWEHRELRVGSTVIKRFRQPAYAQEAILAAFQEQNWSREIDDPLPPRPGLNSKRRLRLTIANLNRNQRNSLIHFYGDGTGERVCWEWRATARQQRG
jgi:hypothetical protein